MKINRGVKKIAETFFPRREKEKSIDLFIFNQKKKKERESKRNPQKKVNLFLQEKLYIYEKN